MKHPGPWSGEEKNGGTAIDVTGSDGARVAYVEADSDEAERLILSASELLGALKALVELDDRNEFDYPHDAESCGSTFGAARSLIERIEKGARPLHICGECPPGVVGMPADELRRVCERNSDGFSGGPPPQWQCVLWAPHPGKPHEDFRGSKFDVDGPCWKAKKVT